MAANKTKPAGRPKGSKNKLTLVTEAYEKKALRAAGGLMLKELQAITEAVVERAKGGDMTAAKLIYDRLIPVKRASEDLAAGSMNIQINIVGSTHENPTSSEQDRSEPGPANGQVYESPQGGQVVTVNAGTEG